MAGSYTYDKGKPFFSDEEVDDAFLRSGGGRNFGGSGGGSAEERQRQLLEERRKIEERTVQSSFRSLSLLKESEDVGAATAEELNRQREQLQNAEVKLDEINTTLKVSQRHIQGIKSVFGSIRNYFSGNKNNAVGMTSSASADLGKLDEGAEEKSKLSQILEKADTDYNSAASSGPHPTERTRSNEFQPLASRDVDSILDRNLEDIGVSISRLKNLGMDLNREIEDQNSMIDRITNKSENVDFKIKNQTRDMNKILKK